MNANELRYSDKNLTFRHRSVLVAGMMSTSDIDRDNHVVDPKAFGKTIVGKPLCVGHHKHMIVGQVLSATLLPYGVLVTAYIDLYSQHAQLALKLVRTGGLSVGMFIEASQEAVVAKKKVTHITRARLAEVSLVECPCNCYCKCTKIS